MPSICTRLIPCLPRFIGFMKICHSCLKLLLALASERREALRRDHVGHVDPDRFRCPPSWRVLDKRHSGGKG